MPTLLYRFQEAERFPLLEGETSAQGKVQLGISGHDDARFLRIRITAQPVQLPHAAVVIGLPLLAVDGTPERILLEVCGDASGCEVLLDAGDARGWGFSYTLGKVTYRGWQTCSADAGNPSEYWGERQVAGKRQVVPPIQLFRVRIDMEGAPAGRAVVLGLRALFITGDVRITSPGIASM